MTITEILSDNTLTDKHKLGKVANIIEDVREEYGNSHIRLPEAKVSTVDGLMPFRLLENNSKVAVLLTEVSNIKAKVVNAVEDVPGISARKKTEELLATSCLFSDITTDTGLGCL